MDIEQLKDSTENVSVSFRKSTLKRIRAFMKKNNIKMFSPVIDRIISDWLNAQEEQK